MWYRCLLTDNCLFLLQLLLDHQDRVAPDNNDPLHELLEDLGEVPTGHELLGMYINLSKGLVSNLFFRPIR